MTSNRAGYASRKRRAARATRAGFRSAQSVARFSRHHMEGTDYRASTDRAVTASDGDTFAEPRQSPPSDTSAHGAGRADDGAPTDRNSRGKRARYLTSTSAGAMSTGQRTAVTGDTGDGSRELGRQRSAPKPVSSAGDHGSSRPVSSLPVSTSTPPLDSHPSKRDIVALETRKGSPALALVSGGPRSVTTEYTPGTEPTGR